MDGDVSAHMVPLAQKDGISETAQEEMKKEKSRIAYRKLQGKMTQSPLGRDNPGEDM